MNKIKEKLNIIAVFVIIFIMAFIVTSGLVICYEYFINIGISSFIDIIKNPETIDHASKAGIFVGSAFVLVLVFSFKEL
jgi:phosphate starvation-inducible membrane PsiE